MKRSDLYNAGLIKGYTEGRTDSPISLGVVAFDCHEGTVFDVAHNEHITTQNFTNADIEPNESLSIIVRYKQDGTGGRNINLPPEVFQFHDNKVPEINTTPGATNVLLYMKAGSDTKWTVGLFAAIPPAA